MMLSAREVDVKLEEHFEFEARDELEALSILSPDIENDIVVVRPPVTRATAKQSVCSTRSREGTDHIQRDHQSIAAELKHVPGRQGNQRLNQRLRTRMDLLAAATSLMKQGRKPALDEVAEAALVSRATAYRYFPRVEALLFEASLDIALPEPDLFFADNRSADPARACGTR